MINVPITIIIAVLGIFLTARFQRIQWIRTTREEIRIRETKGATDLVSDIAKAFGRRITAQRSLLRNLKSRKVKKCRDGLDLAIKEYSEGYNEIRYRLNYYTSYQKVLDFEREIHDRLVSNLNKIYALANSKRHSSMEVRKLDDDLSRVSELIFRYCQKLSEEIASENIGRLSEIHDWEDPDNEFIGSWYLIKRLLNI